MKGRITMFTSTACPHCLRAKNELVEHHLPYIEIPVDRYKPMVREVMSALSGGRTSVPQIFFNEHHIGGCDDLIKLMSDQQRFSEMLLNLKNNPAGPDAPPLPEDSMKMDVDHVQHDEYAFMSWQIRQVPGLLKDRTVENDVILKNAFKASDLHAWLVNEKHLGTDSALLMVKQLVIPGFGQNKEENETDFDLEKYYQLLEDSDGDTLNAGPIPSDSTKNLDELSVIIRQQVLKAVDYAGILKDPDFVAYISLVRQLQNADISALGTSIEARLAFFINIYNALMIHATVVLGPARTLWQRSKFFTTVSYKIGNHRFSLNDIEHGILRGNKIGVGAVQPQFREDDPRLQLSLATVQPLIHFALNCGGKSCPPIKTYSTEHIMDELATAARSFIEDDGNVHVIRDASGKISGVAVSQIFDWYRSDFGVDGSDVQIINFLLPYITVSIRNEIQLWMAEQKDTIKLSMLPYDWHLNEK